MYAALLAGCSDATSLAPDLSVSPDLASSDLAAPDLSMLSMDLSVPVETDFAVMLDFAPPPDFTAEPDLGGHLGSSAAPSPATVDLTAEGTLDWIHWGRGGVGSVDRKTVTPLIADFMQIGTDPLHPYSDSAVSYQWSDGTPTASSNGTSTGVYILGEGNGFAVAAPADNTPRTLRVYLSSFGADFTVTAHLSDGSARDFSETVLNTPPSRIYRCYTFAYYSLTPGAALTVSWVDVNDRFGGANVTVEAATLH